MAKSVCVILTRPDSGELRSRGSVFFAAGHHLGVRALFHAREEVQDVAVPEPGKSKPPGHYEWLTLALWPVRAAS